MRKHLRAVAAAAALLTTATAARADDPLWRYPQSRR